METTIKESTKVLYTAKTHTTGGRDHGVSRSSDGHLDIKLSVPATDGIGTNPEQLFAAGWSACFEGAMGIATRKRRITLPEDTAMMLKSISVWIKEVFSCRHDSMRAFPFWIERLRCNWSMKPMIPVSIQKQSRIM